MNKQAWIDAGEVFDTWRVIPRIFLGVCLIWTMHVGYILVYWYIRLPDASRGIEATGFGSAVFLTILGFLKLVYSTYSENGRNWELYHAGKPPSTTTETSKTTITGASS